MLAANDSPPDSARFKSPIRVNAVYNYVFALSVYKNVVLGCPVLVRVNGPDRTPFASVSVPIDAPRVVVPVFDVMVPTDIATVTRSFVTLSVMKAVIAPLPSMIIAQVSAGVPGTPFTVKIPL